MQRITNETNTLCTVTTSFLVVLDSVNASVKNNGDWNSDVTFDFEIQYSIDSIGIIIICLH